MILYAQSQVGDKFKDRAFLVQVLKSYAAMKGFCTRFNGNHIQECSRAGYPKDKENSRKFSGGQLRCGCKFQIKYIPSLHRTVQVVQRSGKVKRTSRAVWDDNEYVTITLANTVHTGGCHPSPQQQVMQKSRSGRYISDISKHALFILCNSHYDGRTVDTMVWSCISYNIHFIQMSNNKSYTISFVRQSKML